MKLQQYDNFFNKSMHWFFMIFCMNLTTVDSVKAENWVNFFGQSSCLGFWGKKAPKWVRKDFFVPLPSGGEGPTKLPLSVIQWVIYQFFWETVYRIFLKYYTKLECLKGVKSDGAKFLRKILILGKNPKNLSKIRFFSIFQKCFFLS